MRSVSMSAKWVLFFVSVCFTLATGLKRPTARQMFRNIQRIQTNNPREFVTLHMAEVAEVATPVHTQNIRSSVDSVRTKMKMMSSSLCNPNDVYRTVDGSCNNLQHPMWGTPMRKQLRLLPAKYDNSMGSPRMFRGQRDPLPSSRTVSQACFPYDNPSNRDSVFSNMAMQWGQFLDHDITGTPEVNNTKNCCTEMYLNGTHPDYYEDGDCFPIFIKEGDRHFQSTCMEFRRSMAAEKYEKRDQLNIITAYIDGSHIYGSTPQEFLETRSFQNGLLKEGDNGQLLLNSTIQRPCLKSDVGSCYFSGDVRVNEFPALTSMHTVFHREHNRIAIELADINPHWDDEALFQQTRKIIAAMMQIISYEEFLPIVMGEAGMKRFGLNSPYKYDPTTNPEIINSFSTAAYRFGHSMIDRTFKTLRNPHQPIDFMYFRPSFNSNGQGSGTDMLIQGMIEAPCQKSDKFFSKGVSDHLFQDFPTVNISFDLGARNIQRGRDHGLPPYIEYRRYTDKYYPYSYPKHNNRNSYVSRLGQRLKQRRFQLVKIRSRSGTPVQILLRGRRARRLTKAPLSPECLRAYNNRLEDVDLFVGGMTETPVDGGMLGPTFASILGIQFKRLRNSDRFWYETQDARIGFTPDQIKALRDVKLARILCDNVKIPHIQKDVFKIPNPVTNPPMHCAGTEIPRLNLRLWRDRPVKLQQRAGMY